MRNLYFRIGQDDLPLFVTAVAIQGSTGGNLGEILENLSAVIRAALQDAAQDQRAGGRRPRLGDDPVVAADRHVPGDPGHHAGVLRQRLARGPHQDRRWRSPAAGWGSATSSCTAWSTSGSDRWISLASHRRRQQHHGGRCWCSWPPARWRSASWRSSACRARSSAAPPTSAPVGDIERGGRPALAAQFEPEGRAAGDRLHHQALCQRQQRRDQGAAPPDDPGRHLRPARGRLLLPRPHRAGGRPGRAGVRVRAGRRTAARCIGC